MNRWLILLLVLFPLFTNCQAINDFIPAKPAYPRLYNDENAYAYYHPYWRKLEDKLINHQKKTANQLVILTVPSTGGYPIENIALEIFRQWGIGDKESNTGLLVLIARKEQQLRIETGYGLEGHVPDITAKKIINSILKPALDSFNFLLPPQHPQQAYLPAIERAIDTLISLTKEPNPQAIKNNGSKIATRRNNAYALLPVALAIIIAIILFIRKRKNTAGKQRADQKPVAADPAKPKRRGSKRTTEGQYLYPLLLLSLLFGITIFWELKWIYFIATGLFLFMRWIYYLPPPVLKKETIAFNKAWEANRKKIKEEYREKKKLLGNEKTYANFDAYWAKYLELGLDKLEKELKLGVFAPRAGGTKKGYTVKSLLYDIFLGSSSTAKKDSFSSTNKKGYSGDSTGGQSAGDYGGGGSGGGGATS